MWNLIGFRKWLKWVDQIVLIRNEKKIFIIRCRLYFIIATIRFHDSRNTLLATPYFILHIDLYISFAPSNDFGDSVE